MRYQPAHAAPGGLPSRLRALSTPARVGLSIAAAAAIGLVPAVFVATAAQAAAGDVTLGTEVLEDLEGAAFTFDLVREGGASPALTITYGTRAGTATPGDDYVEIPPTQFTFAAGRAVTKRITVYGVSDALDEDDENFFLDITGSGLNLSAEGILDDDDNTPTYSLAAAPNPIGEAGGSTKVTATLSAVSGRDVTIPIATANGTATDGEDFTGVNQNLVITKGSTSNFVNVPIIDDTYDEEDTETFTVSGTGATTGTPSTSVTRSGPNATVTINDNDLAPELNLVAPGAVTEGNPLVFEATLSAPSKRTVTAVANTGGGTATPTTDYGPISGQTVTFAPMDQSEQISVSTVNDALNEDVETFDMTLSTLVNATAGTLTGVGGINDDDPLPNVSISPTTLTEGSAGPSNRTFTVHLDAPSGRTVRIGYQVNANTATVGEDFTAVTPGELTFAPGQQDKTITVEVNGDETDEPDETFAIVLSNPGGPTVNSGGALGTNNVTIQDDDNTPVLTTMPNVTEFEGNTNHTVTFRASVTNPSSTAIVLDTSVTEGTAKLTGALPGGSDFDAPATTVTIPAGARFVDFTVPVRGDTVYETDETATITVTTQSGATNVTAGTESATLRLNNDDTAPVITLNTTSGAEGNASLAVTATVSGVAQDAIPFTLAAVGASDNGSDPAEATDFDATSLTASQIPAGFTPGTLPLGTLSLISDQINENTETVRISLTGAGTVAPVYVTITDDPADHLPDIRIGDVTVDENDGTATVPVTLNFGQAGNDATSTERPVSVAYTTVPGSAKPVGDYTTTTGTLNFTPPANGTTPTSADVVVPIIDDSIYEATETFTVKLSSATPAGVVIFDDEATVQIDDDDSGNKPSFSVTAPPTVTENNTTRTANFTIQLSAITVEPVDFTVVMEDITAKHGINTPGNDDYVPPTGPFQIPAGSDRLTVPVTVKGDTVYETQETARMRVNLASGETDATGAEDVKLLTIDDDDPRPTLALTDGQAAEGSSFSVYATVTGVAQDNLPITVTAAGDGTGQNNAASPSDFDTAGLSVTDLTGGAHPAPVLLGTIGASNDRIDEPIETVKVTLTGLLDANGNPPTAFMRITDDPNDLPPTVSVDTPISIAEESGPVTVPVRLTFGAGNDALSTQQTVTVRYDTADGTAKSTPAGSADYTTTGGDLSFSPGTLVQNISVPIINDTLYEANETFTVVLSSPAPTGATLGTATSVVTIVDNDSSQKPTFSVADVQVAEGVAGDTANFVIQLNKATAERIDFAVSTTEGTAKINQAGAGNNDYAAPATTAFIPAGGTSVTVPVPIVNDLVYEQTETATVTVTQAAGENDVVAGTDTSQLQITDNEAVPVITLNTATGVEGTNVSVIATPNTVSQADMTFSLTLTGDGTGSNVAASLTDFEDSGATGTIPAGSIAGRNVTLRSIPLSQDNIDEAVETIKVVVTDTDNRVGTVSSFYRINDDPSDLPPAFSAGSPTVGEGVGSAQVPVTMAFLPGNDATSTEQTVTVNYQTVDGTAKSSAPADYSARSGTLTFQPGDPATKNVAVPVIDDSVYEATETFTLQLSQPTPTGASLAQATGTVTITDNDSAAKPRFTVADPIRFVEGAVGGTVNVVVSVTPATAERIDFTVTATDGTAKHGAAGAGNDDYVPPAATAFIPAGGTQVTIPVTVKDDNVYEATEHAEIEVALANGEDDAEPGTKTTADLEIRDNDPVPSLALNSPVTAAEGATADMTGTVNGVAQDDITLTVALVGDGTGSNVAAGTGDYTDDGDDFLLTGGTASGSTVTVRSIPLDPDTIDEATETVKVTVSDAGNRMATRVGYVRIEDDPDDLPPALVISDESITEDQGSVDLTVTKVFDGDTTATEQPVTVQWQTLAGTARAGYDFTADSGTLTIPAADESGTINVLITDDGLYEGDQEFKVQLGATTPDGVTVDKGEGSVTIEETGEPSAPTITELPTREGAGNVVISGSTSEGTQVQLWGAPTGSASSAYKVLATQNATVSGTYRFTYAVPTGFTFYVRANTYRSISQSVSVKQVPTLAGVSNTKGTALLTVTGNPKTANQAVSIQRYLGSNKWTTVGSGRLNSAGQYAVTDKALKTGSSYTYRAVVASTPAAGIVTGTSANRVVKIK